MWNASVEHIGALIECVKNQPKYISEIMKFDAQSFLIKYDKNLVVGILYIVIGNFKEAYESISLYCSRFVGTSKEVLFFSALKDMLLCKCRNMNYEGLALLYDKTTLMSIETFIQNREVLNYVPYTSFKKCDWDAFMKSHPDFIGMLHVMKNLEKAYIENTPNQENLQEILK